MIVIYTDDLSIHTCITKGIVQKAINKLERYAACVKKLWENEAFLHGDSYFTSIESWFEQLNIGNHAPRDKRIIINSAISALSHPAFTILSDMTAYQKIKQSLNKEITFLQNE